MHSKVTIMPSRVFQRHTAQLISPKENKMIRTLLFLKIDIHQQLTRRLEMI